MIQVPVSFGLSGNPVALGSNGQMIAQCGGSLTGVPPVAQGSVALGLVPPSQHVEHTRLCICGLRLVTNQIGEPLHGGFVEAHIVARLTGTPRETSPAVATLAKSCRSPIRAELDDLCIFRNRKRDSCHGTLDFDFFCLFTSLGGRSYENGKGNAREEHRAQGSLR